MGRVARLGPLVALLLGVTGFGLMSAPTPALDVCPDDPGLRINEEGASPGYMLLAPYEQAYTYLVDIDGHVVKTWRTTTRPGNSSELTPKGELVRAGNLELGGVFANGSGAGGRVEALSWDGQTVWERDFADDTQMQHHQIDVMPNGHVLMILWERIDGPEVLAAGRDPDLLPDNELWPDKIVEYDPTADEVVWEWHTWDHIVQDRDPSKPNYVEDVSTRPDRIDLNYVLPEDNPGQEDWAHVNAVNYNLERDEIVISPRSFNELWVIDHATTTTQAKGPAGDLQFRFGNPRAHGDEGKRRFFAQHDTSWIEPGLPGEGNIILFNNGVRERQFSSVDEVVPELDADGNYVRDPDGGFAAEIKRVYPKRRAEDAGEFAAIVSSAQRLPNGNTLIGYGPQGRVLEVTPEGAVVWEYENPYCARRPTSTRSSKAGFPVSQNWFFQVDRYPPEFPGFVGREEALAR